MSSCSTSACSYMQFASFRTWRFDKMVRRQALQATTLNVSDSQVTSTSTLSHAVRLHTSTPSLAIVVHSTDPGPVVIDRDFLNLDTLSMTQPRPRTRSNNNIHVSHSILTPNHHTTVNKVIHIVSICHLSTHTMRVMPSIGPSHPTQ
jgi:hypothetical protein